MILKDSKISLINILSLLCVCYVKVVQEKLNLNMKHKKIVYICTDIFALQFIELRAKRIYQHK